MSRISESSAYVEQELDIFVDKSDLRYIIEIVIVIVLSPEEHVS